MSLDQPTLLVVTALVVAVSGILLMVSAHSPRRGVDAQGLWGGAMVAGGAGLGLLAVQTPLWNGLSTAILLDASAMSWAAARLFAERRPSLVLMGAGPLTWLLTLPIQFQQGTEWSGLACGIGGLYTLGAAQEILRTRAERLPSRRPALLLLVAHATIYLGRAALGAVGVASGFNLTNLLILESLLHTNGMAFLLLAMVKERFELRTTEQLRNLAKIDALTALPNRRHFDEQFDLEVRRAVRNGSPLALMMIDVDHFKAYNDALGHPAGDACLHQVAATIAAEVLRPGDFVARYGGEEFAVVLANTDRDSAARCAERIRCAVESAATPHPRTGGTVTISVGVAALSRGEPMSAVELLTAADRALYDAKNGGRNTVRTQPGAAAGPDGTGCDPSDAVPHARRVAATEGSTNVPSP